MSTSSSSFPIILEQNDDSYARSPDDCGKNPGEALAEYDFSHCDLNSQVLDHSDAHAALASMSCDDALDYAISQMGGGDHFDTGHFDMPLDTSHDA